MNEVRIVSFYSSGDLNNVCSLPWIWIGPCRKFSRSLIQTPAWSNANSHESTRNSCAHTIQINNIVSPFQWLNLNVTLGVESTRLSSQNHLPLLPTREYAISLLPQKTTFYWSRWHRIDWNPTNKTGILLKTTKETHFVNTMCHWSSGKLFRDLWRLQSKSNWTPKCTKQLVVSTHLLPTWADSLIRWHWTEHRCIEQMNSGQCSQQWQHSSFLVRIALKALRYDFQ